MEQEQERWEAGDLYAQGINEDEVNQDSGGRNGVEGNDPGTIKEAEIELGDKLDADCERRGEFVDDFRFFQLAWMVVPSGRQGIEKEGQRQTIPLAAGWQYTDHRGANVNAGRPGGGHGCGPEERWAGTRKLLGTYYMILFIWHVWTRQIYRDRKKISGCLRMEELDRNWKVGGGEPLKGGKRGFFLEWWKCSKIDCSDDCTALWIYEKPLTCTF